MLRALGKGVLEGNELTLDFTFKVPVKGMADTGTARTPMGFEPAALLQEIRRCEKQRPQAQAPLSQAVSLKAVDVEARAIDARALLLQAGLLTLQPQAQAAAVAPEAAAGMPLIGTEPAVSFQPPNEAAPARATLTSMANNLVSAIHALGAASISL